MTVFKGLSYININFLLNGLHYIFVCFQSLTDRLLRMKAWDSDLEEEESKERAEKETSNGAPGNEEKSGRGDITDTQGHFQKVQKLIYAAKVCDN